MTARADLTVREREALRLLRFARSFMLEPIALRNAADDIRRIERGMCAVTVDYLDRLERAARELEERWYSRPGTARHAYDAHMAAVTGRPLPMPGPEPKLPRPDLREDNGAAHAASAS